MWEYVEEAWDWIVEGFVYFITFEWFGDLSEFIGAGFEGIREFSIYGLVFGLIGTITIYLARDYMLNAFLNHMSPGMKLFWGITTYITTFVAGYFVGKMFENTG